MIIGAVYVSWIVYLKIGCTRMFITGRGEPFPVDAFDSIMEVFVYVQSAKK
jgi:hypothetical protein